MKKHTLMLLVCLLLCAQVSAALANSFGLLGGIYDIVSDDDAYDAYTADADSGNEKVGGRHVNQAILTSRYHNQLIAAVREGKAWKIDTASTTAVYQPGDVRGASPELSHSADGFTLTYDDREVYQFSYVDGQYVLTQVRFNVASAYGDSLLWEGEGYLYWQSGPENSPQPIGDALWRTEQLTLQNFNITQLPRSMADVRRMNTVSRALRIAGGTLGVHEEWQGVKKGRKLAVFSAPDEESYRASSGKASVSTGGNMKLLGAYQGWTMVEYAVSLRTGRIGFVHSSLLSQDMELPLAEEAVTLVTACDTFLTDDPNVSQYKQLTLPAGTQVEGLALYGAHYALVSYSGANQPVWGFVPLRDLTMAGDAARWDVMDLLIGKWHHAGGKEQGANLRVLYSDGTYHGIEKDMELNWLGEEHGQWRVVDCPAKAEYAEKVLYEIVFTLADGTETHYGLQLHEDGAISLLEQDNGAWYERSEYSTFGNG